MKRSGIALALALAAVWTASADVEVWLMRHGETAWNRAKVLQGTIDSPVLTPRGVAMAEATAEGLKAAGIAFDRAYSSPLTRARQTARIVAGAEPRTDARLGEMCFGRYEGVRYGKDAWPDQNLRFLFENPARYVPQGEGAETFDQVGARLRDFLEKEVAPLDGKAGRVLCVSHSQALAALLRTMFPKDAPKAKDLVRNCSAIVLNCADGRFTLKEKDRILYDPAAFKRTMPRTVAHRGAGDLTMPEASIPAYSNAAATVSDIVKLDLQTTRDGVIVMGHDETLTRNMGWKTAIADHDYKEILEKGRIIAKGGFADERIVRLDQALALVKSVPEFWIDFKHFTPEFAEKVLAEFGKAGIDESRVMVATFTLEALAYMKERHPAIRRISHIGRDLDAEGVLARRDKYGLFGVNMPIGGRWTSENDIALLRRNGLWVSLWFVQKESDVAAYPDTEADAFVTDYVTDVRAAFARHGGKPAVFSVKDAGAKGDGKTKDTAAIQRALDACAGRGGRVIVPRGTYLTGTLWLRDRTELHLEEGAVLLGSPDLADYNDEDAFEQNARSPNEGWSGKHLVIAHEVRDVAITGRGVIDGNGGAFLNEGMLRAGESRTKVAFRRGYINIPDRKTMARPGQELAFYECRGVRVEGVTLRNMAMWTCFLHGCDDVTLKDVTIRNDLRFANTDGFDIDACRNVTATGCDIETADDAFAIRCCPRRLKSKRAVCENIRIDDCRVRTECEGVRIGVGDGLVRNVRISHLDVLDSGRGFVVQSIYPGSKSKGLGIEDVVISDCELRKVVQAIAVTAGTEEAESVLRNVTFARIRANLEGGVMVNGLGKTRPAGIVLKDIALTAVKGDHVLAHDWEVGRMDAAPENVIRIERADNVTLENVTVTNGKGVERSRLATADVTGFRNVAADEDGLTHFVVEHPWRVFYDPTMDERDAERVKGYEKTLVLANGRTVKSVETEMDAENRVDMNALLGIAVRKHHYDMDEKDVHRAILVNEIYAPKAGTAWIGATAEWWMRLVVNGEEAYSTIPNGDGYGSIEYVNHVFPVKLRKGRNLVALYTRAGLNPWRVAFGAAPVIPSEWTRNEVRRLAFGTTNQVDCGPWVMYPGADTATVSFLLPRSRRAGLEYRRKGAEEWTKLWQYTTFQKRTDEFFRFELKGLEPDAEYEYRVLTIGKALERSRTFGFRTWSGKAQPVRLALMTDLHLCGRDEISRIEKAATMPGMAEADGVVTLGDSVSTTEDFRGRFLDYFLKGTLATFGHDRYVFAIRGNHECRGEEASEFHRYFPKSSFSARMGEAFFIFLDSGEYNDIFNGTDPDASYNDGAEAYFAAQRRWLEETVRSEACRTAKFRVVMVHAPPCSLGTYEKRYFKPLVDGLLCTWDPKRQPEVKTHLWIAGHKHETWTRESLGINQVELDGPQRIGCAALEVGSDALRLRIYQAATDRLWDEVMVTPDGRMRGVGRFLDNVKVPMRDGVNLAADVYVPSNRPSLKVGCLLSFSPYKATASSKPPMRERAEEWGVVTVSADCRGLCNSEGVFEPWEPRLVDDADDLLRWIASQPWSNGRVVMVGGSYPGNTQLAAMRSGNRALVACAPSVITFDPYPINFQNGILIPQFFQKWHTGLAGSNSWDRLAAHPTRDAWWRARASLRNLRTSKARAFYQAGWFDMLGIDTFNSFKEMPAGSVLRIGPWSHGVNTFDKPEVDYSKLGGSVTEDAEIEFLRSALDGKKSESAKWPGKILMYVMGRNEWRYEKEWPPAGTVGQDFDFTDGKTRSFVHDPANPVPMKGGRIIQNGGQFDQREIEKRPDVLSYTGAELAADLEVIGEVEAELKLGSTAACSDVTVKLVDVYPDGRAMNVLEGINRISFKKGEEKTVRFKLDITAYAFLKGHRIRVDVAGSCAPHFEVNPVPATVTVHAGSKLFLPVRKAL